MDATSLGFCNLTVVMRAKHLLHKLLYFRGVGRLKLTLAASMINMGTRVGTAAVLVIGLGLGIEALPWSYFAGWVGMLCLQVPILAQELKKRSSARSS